ncbi:peptidoglycan-binding domain-containing protein [Streptomyces sp. TRM70308]|uniref:peptidoglycan-binding domain-containing protein n=1 Tax=Streptomyces sp. TRM70308 TaxID=3131932 RepID=UPI003CFEB2E3
MTHGTTRRRPLARTLAVTLTAAAALLTAPVAGGASASASAAALPSCTMADPRLPIIPAVGWDDHQCVLGTGNQGAAVRVLQRALRACNGQNIGVDGIYGPNTRQAVYNVQARAGIARDGVYGPQTAWNMRWQVGDRCMTYLSATR